MPVSPRLSRKLQQTLGDDAAEDLVSWIQNVEAQRAELRELNDLNYSRLDARLTELRRDMQADVAAMHADLGELRQEMRTGFATSAGQLERMAGQLRQEMAQLETRLERRMGDLIKWSFVFWVSAVGAIAALAGVLG
jgi:hypothetical protein